MSGSVTEVDAPIDTGRVIDFLEFRLDGTPHALELGRVRQVVRRPTITRVPRAPSTLRGAATVDGDVVVAVDPYAVLGRDRPFENDAEGTLIVLDRSETPQPAGLVVEAVDGIERRPVESVVPAVDEDDRPFRAAIERDDGRVPVVDVARLIAAVRRRT